MYKNMYYVYVLKNKIVRKSYVGKTNDLNRRIKEHNTGKNTYTKRYAPWEIIYFEKYESKKTLLLKKNITKVMQEELNLN